MLNYSQLNFVHVEAAEALGVQLEGSQGSERVPLVSRGGQHFHPEVLHG